MVGGNEERAVGPPRDVAERHADDDAAEACSVWREHVHAAWRVANTTTPDTSARGIRGPLQASTKSVLLPHKNAICMSCASLRPAAKSRAVERQHVTS